jgi:hypothetical protein
VNRGCKDESAGIGKENLPQLQDHPPQAGGAGDLQGPATQATPGLNGEMPRNLACKLTA